MNGYPPFPPPQPQRRSLAPLILLIVSIALLMFASVRYGERAFSASEPIEAIPRPVVARGNLAEDEKSTIALFENCSRSVVYISPLVHRVSRSIFGYRDEIVESGTGSGFVWDDQGHVVTNYHVIENAAGANVTLPNNETYEADLIGVWPDNDIAVLKIEAPADQLHPIAVGSSGDLQVGQKVFAIGNPYGLDFTLTTGVVSALNREIRAVTGDIISGVIQTDAAINPGNSGGPLLDSAGRLIGINTAIYSRSGASAGIGFAVPVDTVNRVVPQLIAHGKVIRPGLGISIAADAISRRLGLDGVLIIRVNPGSAAELAGLRPTSESSNGRIVLGDVILAIDGKKTRTGEALLNTLEQYEVGDTVELTLNRRGETVTVSATLQVVDEQPGVLRRGGDSR